MLVASFWAGGRRAGPALSRLILLGCGVVAQCQPNSHEGMGSTGVDSVVVDNEMTNTTFSSIVIGGGNDDLLIRANHVLGSGAQGILFVETFIDRFPVPSTNVTVHENDVGSSRLGGIVTAPNNLAYSLITGNIVGENGATGASGIALTSGNTDDVISENRVDNNGRHGIIAQLGAIGNSFEHNSMHGNGFLNPALFFDARDANNPINQWTGNDCATDSPAGAICGVG